MKLPAFAAGLFVVAIIFAADNQPIYANELPNPGVSNDIFKAEIKEDPLVLALAKPQEDAPPKPVEHIVAKDETLTKIAETHTTTWQRLYAKNANIANPDMISAGEKLIVPLADEVLPERPLPPPPPPPAPSVVVSNKKPATAKAKPAARAYTATQATRGSSAGNTYARGYCTWYAKSRRPDLPNNLGNADTWVARAAAQGIPTGSVPRAGAIGQQGMHVVYVEAVNGDGTIRVSEMNYAGIGVVSSRIASAGSFQYIY